MEKIHLSPILDLYNGEIIRYNISLKLTFEKIKDILDKLFKVVLKNKEIMLHLNQSWQYQIKYYQKASKEKDIIQSMM